MSDELTEKVAKEIHYGLGEGWAYSAYGGDELSTCMDQLIRAADAAIALVLEEAAKVAEGFPAKAHGNLATAPYAAVEQAADEIAAAIRALATPSEAHPGESR